MTSFNFVSSVSRRSWTSTRTIWWTGKDAIKLFWHEDPVYDRPVYMALAHTFVPLSDQKFCVTKLEGDKTEGVEGRILL